MAAALPDRYGVAPPTKDHVVTNNFLVSIGIAAAACGIAVMAASLPVKTSQFFDFANYALTVLQQTQFVVYVAYGSLVLGFLGICAGFLVSMSGLYISKFPRFVYVAIFLLVACGAGNIAAGSVVMQGVTQLNDAIYAQPATPAAVGTFTSEAIHFQIAMFNGCCAAQKFSNETFTSDVREETKDPDGYVKFCDSLHEANLDDMDRTKRRTCFRDEVTYYRYNFSVMANQNRICQTLTDARVNVAGKKVPGTNFDVTGFTGGNPIVPIVGPNTPPNYGCGIGYAKAFQAAQLIWVANIIQPVGTTFIACGAVYVILALLSLVTFYSCSQSRETAEEKYARYMEELNSSSQGVVKTSPQVADSFEQPNPNRMSVQNPQYSNRMSVQSHATNGSNRNPTQEVPLAATFNVDDKI